MPRRRHVASHGNPASEVGHGDRRNEPPRSIRVSWEFLELGVISRALSGFEWQRILCDTFFHVTHQRLVLCAFILPTRLSMTTRILTEDLCYCPCTFRPWRRGPVVGTCDGWNGLDFGHNRFILHFEIVASVVRS